MNQTRAEALRDKVVLVTGGTGSFGNFIVHRLLDLPVREVRVLSRDEKKQYDMKVFYTGCSKLSFVIGDIRSPEVLDEAMDGVAVVFQAAALKQVPTCERFPLEAIQTNTLGVENAIRAALKRRVEAFVTISTDKAVKPVNVMGMTKALQERLVTRANLSRSNHGTRFACVRYGNVLRSRGSVVPFFRRQLSLGQRLTVTDDRMTRFLLTLNDAIDLVLHAATSAEGGETFVRKAPAGRLIDIAAVLATEAGRPLEYDLIGTLPGEKIDEILVSEEEIRRTEDIGDYFTIHPWWKARLFSDLRGEYSSRDQLVDRDEVARLIGRADTEFEAMEVVGGEFSRF